MSEVLGEDRTLQSDAFGAWQIAALESGTAPGEIEAAATVRLRFLAATAITDEIMGSRLTAEAATEAARQIHAVSRATAPLSLYWGEATPEDAPASTGTL